LKKAWTNFIFEFVIVIYILQILTYKFIFFDNVLNQTDCYSYHNKREKRCFNNNNHNNNIDQQKGLLLTRDSKLLIEAVTEIISNARLFGFVSCWLSRLVLSCLVIKQHNNKIMWQWKTEVEIAICYLSVTKNFHSE
jgi:hypothetical protein